MLYTSGTSGNNKVVKISGFKTHFMGWSIANLCRFSSEDVFYTPLPLFHGNGGGMCLGQMLWNGSTVVIRLEKENYLLREMINLGTNSQLRNSGSTFLHTRRV